MTPESRGDEGEEWCELSPAREPWPRDPQPSAAHGLPMCTVPTASARADPLGFYGSPLGFYGSPLGFYGLRE